MSSRLGISDKSSEQRSLAHEGRIHSCGDPAARGEVDIELTAYRLAAELPTSLHAEVANWSKFDPLDHRDSARSIG